MIGNFNKRGRCCRGADARVEWREAFVRDGVDFPLIAVYNVLLN